jgi:Heavy metal binding domain
MAQSAVQPPSAGQVYFCPMHRGVRQPGPGKCPKCGMDLVPEGTRFALLQHMSKHPIMLVVMAGVMVAIMAVVMMLM